MSSNFVDGNRLYKKSSDNFLSDENREQTIVIIIIILMIIIIVVDVDLQTLARSDVTSTR